MSLVNQIAVSGYDFQHLEFTRFLDLLRQWDIKHMELWPGNVLGWSVEQVKQALADKNIAVICVNAGIDFLPNKAGGAARVQAGIIEAVKLAETLQAPLVNTYMGGNPHRDMLTTVQLYRHTMQPCLEAAKERGITLLLENHFDNRNEDPQGTDVARRPETLLYLVEAVDSPYFKLTYDPCNFYIAGEEPYPYTYQLLQPHIGYVHIKDATRYSELLHGTAGQYKLLPDSLRGRFLPVALGEGATNYEGILNSLNRDGYAGYLAVEPHTEQARVETVGAANIQYLHAHLAR